MRYIKARIKLYRYGYQQQRAICFSNEKDLVVVIKEKTNIKGGKQKYRNTFHKITCTQKTATLNTILNDIKNINHTRNKGKTTVK